tara:strand:+ start:360 stop:968 length:609 start_codon:yes stop_codon:yes gene_type:complete
MGCEYNYNQKKVGCFLIVVVFIIILISFVNFISAIGVAAPYSGSELPLEMYVGEERVVNLELQNWDIDEEIVFEGKILGGEEIAFLKESSVNVPYQVKTPTEMVVKIPNKAKVGDIYNIQYEYKQVGGGGEGMVVFSQGIKRNFDVYVIEEVPITAFEGEIETPDESISIIWWILGIIFIFIFIILIWFFIRKRRDKEIENF